MNIAEIKDVDGIDQSSSVEGLDFIDSGNQFLTLTLGNEHYGIDILCVEEIRGWETPTLIPNAPVHVIGVVNLRGAIVPITDLRMQFSVGEITYSQTTVVVVLASNVNGRKRTMGFVVDAVSDVINVEENDIKAAPTFGGNIPPHYVNRLVSSGDNMITLLNIEALQRLETDSVNC